MKRTARLAIKPAPRLVGGLEDLLDDGPLEWSLRCEVSSRVVWALGGRPSQEQPRTRVSMIAAWGALSG